VQTQGGVGGGAASSAGLPFDEESKLVYGVILSLRNMVKRLSGRYVSLPTPSPSLFRGYRADRCLSCVPRRRVRRAHGVGMSHLSATAHQHTSCIFSKRSRATASSC
jgi:hypothetical protein